MKSLIFFSFIVLVLSGCSSDLESLNKQECTNLGYKFVVEERLNYRTGKQEIKATCLENK